MRKNKTTRFRNAIARKAKSAAVDHPGRKNPKQRAFNAQTGSTGPNGPSALRRQFYREENK